MCVWVSVCMCVGECVYVCVGECVYVCVWVSVCMCVILVQYIYTYIFDGVECTCTSTLLVLNVCTLSVY